MTSLREIYAFYDAPLDFNILSAMREAEIDLGYRDHPLMQVVRAVEYYARYPLAARR